MGHCPPRCGRAVVGDDAAHQRQIRGVAELHRHGQLQLVARRGEDRRDGEALLRAALGEKHRCQDREHQAGSDGQPQLADARNDGVASHGSTRTTTCLSAPIRALAPNEMEIGAMHPPLQLIQFVAAGRKLSCYARAPGRTSRCDSRLAPDASRGTGHGKPARPDMPHPLWTPNPARSAQTTLAAFSSWLAARAGTAARRFRRAASVLDRRFGRVLVGALGFCGDCRRQGRSRPISSMETECRGRRSSRTHG